jgi:sec-independent protein translocase protein TatA
LATVYWLLCPVLTKIEREVVPFGLLGGHMIGKLGLPEILVILAVALLIFGPGRLSELGKGLGEGIRNFRSAVKDGEKEPEKK